MSEPQGGEQPVDTESREAGVDPAGPSADVGAHPKAIEARANLEFQARLREVTPRTGVARALVAVNALVFIAMVTAGVSAMAPTVADLIKWGGNYGPRTLGGQPWRIVTAAFLHAGLLHVAMNMFVLWSVGPFVERIFGSARFATIYVCAAVTGGIASVAFHPHVTSVGASGAVFGLYGALAAFLLVERGGIPGPVIARLARVAGTFVLYNVVFGFTHAEVDNAAHLGGLLGGALAGAWLARPLAVDRAAAPLRLAAALALSALAMVGATRILPAPPDFDAALHDFFAVETTTIDTYNALLKRAQEGQLTDKDFAAGLERDVLPPWRAARAALTAPRRWMPPQRAVLERIDRYAEARERAWALFARFGRTHSVDDQTAAREAQDEAKRLLEEMKKGKP